MKDNANYSIDDIAGFIVNYTNTVDKPISLKQLKFCLKYINKNYSIFYQQNKKCCSGSFKTVKSYYPNFDNDQTLPSQNLKFNDLFIGHDEELIVDLYNQAYLAYYSQEKKLNSWFKSIIILIACIIAIAIIVVAIIKLPPIIESLFKPIGESPKEVISESIDEILKCLISASGFLMGIAMFWLTTSALIKFMQQDR